MLVLLHGLGGSARIWDGVAAALGPAMACVALDLPGYGANAHLTALTVEQTVDWTMRQIAARNPGPWMLAGHSMGGKIATIVAARAGAGTHGLPPPAGIVLVAASPPCPEPMSDSRRQDMVGWASDGPVSADHARQFIQANTAAALPDAVMLPAMADVRRAAPVAWCGWLERGSLEDWSGVVGTVRTPALLVAGAADGDLDADAQRRLTLPHFPGGRVVVVQDAAHLIPLEQPQRLAMLIAEHWRGLQGLQPALPPAFASLIASDRVSARTRQALLGRLAEPGPDAPGVLGLARRQLLAALLARVLPQRGTAIDLAARIDVALASGPGDGWRFAALPPDADAWRHGLDTLADLAGRFAELPGEQQDAWIGRMIAGQAGIEATPGRLSAQQMTLWFEDVRSEAVRTWLAHPAALARIGYDGFANGGDGARPQGYLRVGADVREGWQPGPQDPQDGTPA